MAFSLGCFACCGCDPCTAECDTTPDDNFEVVYQANDTDGTLQWTGDAMGPIDGGPYTGFWGSGPFFQTITLAENFSVTMPGTRFPCYARVKFWRNVGGGEGSEAVTQEVTITCNSGKVSIGPVVLTAGESVYIGPDPGSSTATYGFETDDAIPLVSGGDDQSASPPASWFSAAAECSPSSISVTATITWSNAAIQHNLYGTFVECYDELPPGDPNDCLDCDGTPTPAPETVYLTISNFDGGGAVDANDDPIVLNGTYAIPLSNGYPVSCHDYTLFGTPVIAWRSTGWPFGFWLDLNVAGKANGSSGALTVPVDIKPEWAGDGVSLWVAELCGAGPVTGTVASAEWYLTQNLALALRGDPTGLFCSFDWELSW